MAIIHWPRVRRVYIYDPPTPLDQFLLSPLRAIVQHLYVIFLALRGAPFQPPRTKPPVCIVCISDTHTNNPKVPNGDLLIHAGDLTNRGTVEEIQAQLDWIDSLPHKHKIIIAGNHDSYFDTASRGLEDKESGASLDFHDIHYLQDSSVELGFDGGRTLSFYGAGDIPQCGGSNFAFQYNPPYHPWKNRVPDGTDVLITHTPPRYHLDLDLGCAGLLQEIWRVKPRLHVVGHIHAAHGRESLFWDKGQLAFERLMARKKAGVIKDCFPSGAWLDAIKVVWYGVKGILWQHLMVGSAGSNGGLLVNAAIVSWRSPDVVGSSAEVVQL